MWMRRVGGGGGFFLDSRGKVQIQEMKKTKKKRARKGSKEERKGSREERKDRKEERRKDRNNDRNRCSFVKMR